LCLSTTESFPQSLSCRIARKTALCCWSLSGRRTFCSGLLPSSTSAVVPVRNEGDGRTQSASGSMLAAACRSGARGGGRGVAVFRSRGGKSVRDSHGMASQPSWYTQQAPALPIVQVQGRWCQALPARTGDARAVLDLMASCQRRRHAASLVAGAKFEPWLMSYCWRTQKR
jgi:hypothetical protein